MRCFRTYNAVHLLKHAHKLSDLRKEVSKGHIGRAIDATKDALKTKKDTMPSTTGNEEDPSIKEKIKQLETQREGECSSGPRSRDACTPLIFKLQG